MNLDLDLVNGLCGREPTPYMYGVEPERSPKYGSNYQGIQFSEE